MARRCGDIVRAALEAKGMTQLQLARRIGKDQTLISRFLSGQPVSDATMRAIAEVLELDFEELRLQLQRDRFERQRESLKTEFREVLSEDEKASLLSPDRLVQVGNVSIEEIPGIVIIPLLDSVPVGALDQVREKAEPFVLPFGVQVDVKRAFALKIRGENLTDDNIGEGDVIVVDPGAEVQDGDRVLVILNKEPALKKIYRKGKTTVLQSAEDIFLPQGKDFEIIGRVVLCIKCFVR